jgi:uncharacterized protein (DUF1697 family)
MRYAALLRAINVGGHTVKMKELCAMFEAMKLSNVRSVIASGNVLFDARTSDAAALETRIETALRRSLGYDVETFLRTPEELDALAAHDPFAANDPVLDGHRVHVLFTRSTVTAAEKKQVLALATDYDDFAVYGREIYWRTRGNSSDSTITPAMWRRTFDRPMTARNVTTVRKLADKLRA